MLGRNSENCGNDELKNDGGEEIWNSKVGKREEVNASLKREALIKFKVLF